MKYVLLGVLIIALLCPSCVFAQKDDKNKAKTEAEPEIGSQRLDPKAQEREMLIANFNNLRNQELRVAVLQQLLNEAVVQLRNIQAVFCDTYKLDVEKFRQGLYRYDDKEAKFVEIKPQEAQ